MLHYELSTFLSRIILNYVYKSMVLFKIISSFKNNSINQHFTCYIKILFYDRFKKHKINYSIIILYYYIYFYVINYIVNDKLKVKQFTHSN